MAGAREESDDGVNWGLLVSIPSDRRERKSRLARCDVQMVSGVFLLATTPAAWIQCTDGGHSRDGGQEAEGGEERRRAQRRAAVLPALACGCGEHAPAISGGDRCTRRC
jgi:hypothetical protein